jgi:hypothetical protein
MLKNHMAYLWYSWRYPESKDFIDMGIGIEARYARCKDYWGEHLRQSKSFQSLILKDGEKAKTVTILGGGRFLDIAVEPLLGTCRSLLCFDADPSAKRAAVRKVQKIPNVRYEIMEITGSLVRWTRSFEAFAKRLGKNCEKHEIANFLCGLRSSPPPLDIPKTGTLLSINLLSQIPLYWRDRVLKTLAFQWSIMPDHYGNLEETLQAGLTASMAELQRAHLELIQNSRVPSVILIFDVEFHYYDAKRTFLKEPALLVGLEENLPHYQLLRIADWDWEIAPLGIEEKTFGVRHKVRALELALGG